MPQTLLTGATGTLGRALVPRLQAAGHTVRAASRSPPDGAAPPTKDVDEWVELDLRTGDGLDRAVTDADVVVHAATAPHGDTEAVDVEGTRRLLDAAHAAGVTNVCHVSIVGCNAIPFSYYEHKHAAERAVERHDQETTVVRSTQFHEFVADLLGSVSRLPVWPLPTGFRLQPIAVEEAAAAVVEHATPAPGGRVPPAGGPEVHSVGELACAYRASRGLRRPVVRLPLPGAVARGFRAGEATCPDRAVGETTWEGWLAEHDGGATAATPGAEAQP